MRADDATSGGQQLELHLTGDLALTAVKHPVHLSQFTRYRRHRDQRPAMPVRITGLGYGYIEPAEPGQGWPDDCALVFQRTDIAQQHIAFEDADVGAGMLIHNEP